MRNNKEREREMRERERERESRKDQGQKASRRAQNIFEREGMQREAQASKNDETS